MMYRNTHSAPLDNALIVRGRERMMLVRPEFATSLVPDCFTPAFWGSCAEPVDFGGRGAAWFLNGSETSWMLRSYQRGGLVARFNHETYWFTGQSSVRSFAEFHLLNRLYALGLPVPKPVAASYHRVGGLWYRAQIIVERIPDATPFSRHLLSGEASLWAKVGQLIRRFHDCGVCHADLNCHNILISGSKLYLIDFDKSKIRAGSRWKQRNLKRLRRSIQKILENADPVETDRRWQKLCHAYQAVKTSGYPLNMLIACGLLPILDTTMNFKWDLIF